MQLVIKFPKISYDYPKWGGKNNPFDIEAKGKYFVYAAGFTYLSQSLRPFALKKPYWGEQMHDAIPMGYKALLVNERFAFIENGEIIEIFKQVKENIIMKYFDKYHLSNAYMIYSSDKIYYKKWSDPRHYVSTKDEQNCYWRDKEEVLNFALDYSKNCRKDNLIMVCKLIASIDWH